MDILIPDIWLRDYLKTKATIKEIAKYLSLCGPSVERVVNSTYLTEITTNRVDSASVYGFAREAAVILPQFKISAKFKPLATKPKQKFVKNVPYLDVKVDSQLCPRFTAILIKNIKIGDSPVWMKERLGLVGTRSINNIVDVSNFVMHELGNPVHIFDYDKIVGHKMVLRSGKKGEKITTLDGKTHELPGGDIVITDGSQKIIDLAGIMGGQNSEVDINTKNVLLFVPIYNPINIRKTSMNLAKRSGAAVLFEKDIDPETVSLAVKRGIDLLTEIAKGTPAKEILDIYPMLYKKRKIKIDYNFINKKIGVEIPKKEIDRILTSLGIVDGYIPSWRAQDIKIQEDIVEEIARIYGYHNLPSQLPGGVIPNPLLNSPFEFEMKIKNILMALGAVETYTLSMVPKKYISKNAIKITNPLGQDMEYLRTNLMPSLSQAAKQNSGQTDPFHIFEMANVYLARRSQAKAASSLPEERMILAGVFANLEYSNAKEVVESLLKSINIIADFEIEDSNGYLPNHRLIIKDLGQFGQTENNLIYYEFDMQHLKAKSKPINKFTPIPTYPPQIEDLTFIFPTKTAVGNVLSYMKSVNQNINDVELKDIYKNSYTFRVQYLDRSKTLTNKEVEKLREKLLDAVKQKFGGVLKN